MIISLRKKAGYIQSGETSIAAAVISIPGLRTEIHIENIITTIIINIFFLYLVLKSYSSTEQLFGKSGWSMIRKVFGLILLAIAIKFFGSNIHPILP